MRRDVLFCSELGNLICAEFVEYCRLGQMRR